MDLRGLLLGEGGEGMVVKLVLGTEGRNLGDEEGGKGGKKGTG